MNYKIEQGYRQEYYIYYMRSNHWRLLLNTPAFLQHTDAYTWLVSHKFDGNHALASLHLWSS